MLSQEVEIDKTIRASSEGELACSPPLGDVVRRAGRNAASSSGQPESKALIRPTESQGKPRWDGPPRFQVSLQTETALIAASS